MNGGPAAAPNANRTLETRGHLLRVLGLAFGVAVGVGSMVGGGILRAPGSVFDHVPVPALALALWVVAGFQSLLEANVIAEVMTAIPKSGGMFVPARAAFGPSAGLLIGWTDWLINVATIAALSIASGEFAVIIIPQLRGSQSEVGSAITLLLFLFNWIGVREGSAAQIIGSSLKGVFLVGLTAAVVFVPPAKSTGIVASGSMHGAVSFWGLVVAYQLILGVYSGWGNPAYFSEEDTAPSKNIPRSLFISVVSVCALYVSINAALIYSVPLAELRSADLPIALAVGNIFGPLGTKIVAAVAIVIIASCNNATIMVAPRILFGLSREGMFPAFAQRLNRGGTPSVALVITAVFSLLSALTGSFELLFLMLGALGLLPLIFAEAAYFKLRVSSPNLPRPYRAIGHPWLPALALLIELLLLIAFISADLKTGISIVIAVGVCIPIGWWMRSRRIAPVN